MDGIIRKLRRAVPDTKQRMGVYQVLIEEMRNEDWDTEDECRGQDAAFDAALDTLSKEDYRVHRLLTDPRIEPPREQPAEFGLSDLRAQIARRLRTLPRTTHSALMMSGAPGCREYVSAAHVEELAQQLEAAAAPPCACGDSRCGGCDAARPSEALSRRLGHQLTKPHGGLYQALLQLWFRRPDGSAPNPLTDPPDETTGVMQETREQTAAFLSDVVLRHWDGVCGCQKQKREDVMTDTPQASNAYPPCPLHPNGLTGPDGCSTCINGIHDGDLEVDALAGLDRDGGES
jgi:hypothetical protein